MIKMMRVDDRLIHGQVAVMWSKELGIQRIIVASDQIAANAIQVNALKMAAPAGVKAAILPIDKAVEILTDPRASQMKILVISNNPEDLLKVAGKIEEKPDLNVANYGRIGGGALSSKTKISESVYVTDHDVTVLERINSLGLTIIHQPLPGDPRQDFMKLLGGHKSC